MQETQTQQPTQTNGFEPIFPGLTTGQRYHLDVNGYVVIERLLSEDQVAVLNEALQRLKAEFVATGDPWNVTIRNCQIFGQSMEWAGPRVQFDNFMETDPVFMDYLAHPRIVGMAEEVVGGQVRIEESQAIINSRAPGAVYDGPPRHQWHHLRPGFSTFTENGLFHCHMVKALTNLTDLGPDDGGTSVIAGSHKIDAPEEDIVAAAREDPSLVHEVVAPAGSTLLFSETLLHSSGELRSDRERTVIIGGYVARMMAAGVRQPTPEFVEGLPDSLKDLATGSQRALRVRRRTLGTPVGMGDTTEYYDGWSVDSTDAAKVEELKVAALTKSRKTVTP